MANRWQYLTIEWLWDTGNIRADMPDGQIRREQGSYAEVVALLNELGGEGWEAVSCAPGANWLFWTLKRNASESNGSW